MDDLNPIIVAISIIMYVTPAVSVFCAISVCCYIIHKNNKLEANYVQKNKLLGSIELQEINHQQSNENDVEIELVKLEDNELNVIGIDSEELYTV